jgi:hypothetical protein
MDDACYLEFYLRGWIAEAICKGSARALLSFRLADYPIRTNKMASYWTTRQTGQCIHRGGSPLNGC